MNKLIRSLAMLLLLVPAVASAQWRWEAGKHYVAISPAISTGQAPAGKIEVTEVFSYGCPACWQAAPEVRKLKAQLPSDAVMTYVPASFIPTEAWPMFQRAYLTARALGIAEANHDLFFTAVWESGEVPLLDRSGRVRSPLPTIEEAAAFYAKRSKVTSAEFLARARSPQIEEQMRAADAYVKGGKVPSTPSFVVNGRYLLNNQAIGSWDAVRQVVNFLVAQERARLKMPPPKQ